MRIIAVAALALFWTIGLVAAAPKQPATPILLTDSDRSGENAYAVQTVVAQHQLEPTIDPGRVARPPGGGLLDTLVIYSMDDKKQTIERSLMDKAVQLVVPVRQALKGLDVDALAMDTTKAALAAPPWLKAQSVTMGKDASLQARARFIDGSAEPQSATVVYRYEMAPDFSHLRVIAEVALARKLVSKDGSSLQGHATFYRQHIVSVAQLKARAFENHENAAKWAAEDGKLAKAGLTSAFSELQRLIPMALGLAAKDVKAFTAKDREKAFGAGFYGPLIERKPDGSGDVLLWLDGLLFVHTLDDN